MLPRLRAFFSAPARQAILWTLLGILGIGFAGAGAMFFLQGDDEKTFIPTTLDRTATATATASTSVSPSASPGTSPAGSATVEPTRIGLTATAFAQEQSAKTATAIALTPTPSATAQPTRTPVPTPPPDSGEDGPDDPAPVPTEEVTATPVPPTPTAAPVALQYCDTTSGGTTPPNAIFGTVTIGGAAAPAGTVVTIAFDGVPALSSTVAVDGGAAGYRFLYGVGGGGCTNHSGASISIIVEGASHPAPVLVGGAVATLFNVGS